MDKTLTFEDAVTIASLPEGGFVVVSDILREDGTTETLPSFFTHNYDVLDGERLEAEDLQRALYEVKERLGIFGSKHDPWRVTIEVVDQRGKKK